MQLDARDTSSGSNLPHAHSISQQFLSTMLLILVLLVAAQGSFFLAESRSKATTQTSEQATRPLNESRNLSSVQLQLPQVAGDWSPDEVSVKTIASLIKTHDMNAVVIVRAGKDEVIGSAHNLRSALEAAFVPMQYLSIRAAIGDRGIELITSIKTDAYQ